LKRVAKAIPQANDSATMILVYRFDQMAIVEFVRFAAQVLADYKAVLHDKTNAMLFAEILNVFVSVG
jgi:hypothetical protein